MKAGILVFLEHNSGRFSSSVRELLSEASRLARRLDVPVSAACIGYGIGESLENLGQWGCDQVFAVEDERLAFYTPLPFVRAMIHLIGKYDPVIVLYGASSMGRSLAPRIASALRVGLTADCTALAIGDYTSKGSTYGNILMQIRPAFGGNIMATIVTPRSKPSMATVRPGVMKVCEPLAGKKAAVIRERVEFRGEDFVTEILEFIKREKEVNLEEAHVIVSAGMGAGNPESLALVKELCRVLGGALGASRAIVDGGFLSKDHQVGQTGTTVRPNLYVACGISGQIQHRAGMMESKRIVAINTDPEAPIFKIAHYGIVGDLNKIIPMLIRAYQEQARGRAE